MAAIVGLDTHQSLASQVFALLAGLLALSAALSLMFRALVEVRREGAAPVGPFGALTALLDGDVQRAVGFSLAVARRLGQLLAR